MDLLLNKIKGGLYGLASGDALGCTLEFLNEAQIKHMVNVFGKHKDIKGGGPFHFEEGEVTDDTDMALCVARGIIENPINPIPSIGREFLKWLDSDPKDVGMTVRQSLVNFHHVQDWEEASLISHNTLNGRSGGNGSLMRCLPIALAYNDSHLITRYSFKQSKLTHHDPTAGECCILYNQIANLLMDDIPLRDSLNKVLEGTQFLYSLENKPDCLPDAYVIHTFKWMCYLLYNTSSYEDAVIEAVNMGYDSDTLGSVVGGLAGIFYGFDNIPERFVSKLLCSDDLLKTSRLLKDIRANKEW